MEAQGCFPGVTPNKKIFINIFFVGVTPGRPTLPALPPLLSFKN
jgi:hypothetical protein